MTELFINNLHGRAHFNYSWEWVSREEDFIKREKGRDETKDVNSEKENNK